MYTHNPCPCPAQDPQASRRWLTDVFDPALPTELHCDASDVGIGPVLVPQPSDLSRAVSYYS
eukprot:336410-Hanusia_phi.AAC.2